MKTRIILICLFTIFLFTPGKSQVTIIRLDCPDSLGFITNQGISRACEFYLEDEEPNIFYVENLSHSDFYNVVFKNNRTIISRAKVVLPNYSPNIHDFVFCYNKANALLFYYILKDYQEEKLLQQ